MSSSTRPAFRPAPRLALPAAGLLLLVLLGAGCKNRINHFHPQLLATVRASVGNGGIQGNGTVSPERPDVSDDGRFVVFATTASNFVAGDGNSRDVFLRDNVAKTTTLISVNAAGTGTGNAESFSPTVSGDGKFVAFVSRATDIINFPVLDMGTKADALQDIFVRDVQNNQTILISRASTASGTKGNSNSTNPRISKDGRFVVFDSTASNIHPDDGDARPDVFMRQIGAGAGQHTTTLISRATGVSGAKGTRPTLAEAVSQNPSVSADGAFVVFESNCPNLTPSSLPASEGGPKAAANISDIFIRDTVGNTTSRVSLAPSGPIDPNGSSLTPSISADGTVITWSSTASNFFAGDDTLSDIFLRDLTASPLGGTVLIELLSVHSSGAHAGSGCNLPMVSGNGKLVVWNSPSTNLVDGDANGVIDIFLRDRVSALTTRISVSTFGGELNARSQFPAISTDGRYVAFYTEATNASDDDTNGAADIFLRGPPF